MHECLFAMEVTRSGARAITQARVQVTVRTILCEHGRTCWRFQRRRQRLSVQTLQAGESPLAHSTKLQIFRGFFSVPRDVAETHQTSQTFRLSTGPGWRKLAAAQGGCRRTVACTSKAEALSGPCQCRSDLLVLQYAAVHAHFGFRSEHTRAYLCSPRLSSASPPQAGL